MQLLSTSHFKENAGEQRVNADLPIRWLIISIKVFSTQKCFNASSWLPAQNLDNPMYWLCFVFFSLAWIFHNLYIHTHIKSQSPMYTLGFSAFIQSKELFMCWKESDGGGVGSLSTERGLWAVLNRAGCHHLVPGLCLLAAFGLVVCVCLGGYLFRRMPPIWGLTAVLSASSESFSQLPLSQKKVFTHSHWKTPERNPIA